MCTGKKRRNALAILLILCFVELLANSGIAWAQERRNFLWKVRSKSSSLYLLGSIHFLKPEHYPLNKTIEAAFAESTRLVVEANVSDAGKFSSSELLKKAVYPPNESLEKHVSRETYDYLKRETGKLGLPAELVNRQRPWFLALTVEALELAKLGFDPSYGVDAHFLSRAQGSKEILELEGVDEQLRLLSGFSDKDQELFLLYTLKDLNSLGDEATKLVNAWAAGNVSAIEAIITKTIREEPRLEPVFKRLLDDRNRTMVAKIEEYLTTGEIYFVVVGAGHFVGAKGIVQILKDKGYAVEQL
jgi:uncharacterized protein